MTQNDWIQLTIHSDKTGDRIRFDAVLAAVEKAGVPLADLSATVLGGGFMVGPNVGPLNHAIEDQGQASGSDGRELLGWLESGQAVSDIHLWSDDLALGQFDSGFCYVIGPQSVIESLTPAFGETEVSSQLRRCSPRTAGSGQCTARRVKHDDVPGPPRTREPP